MIKKWPVAALILLIAPAGAFFLGTLTPLRGRWVEHTVSASLSRATGLDFQCREVSVHRWSSVRINALEVKSADNRILGHGGPVLLDLNRPFFLGAEGRVLIDAKKVSLNSALLPTLEGVSSRLSIKGSLRLERERLSGADIQLHFDDPLSGKIAENLRGGIHIIYRDRRITVSGASGPLYEAQWQ